MPDDRVHFGALVIERDVSQPRGADPRRQPRLDQRPALPDVPQDHAVDLLERRPELPGYVESHILPTVAKAMFLTHDLSLRAAAADV